MYRYEKINEEYFDQLIQWKYGEEFSCYDMEDRLTTINQLFEKEGYDFFVGIDIDNEIVGYMECFFKDDVLEVGHGLNPILIGQGLSYDFIMSSIEFAVEEYNYVGDIIRILIEPFNKRAFRIYSRIGFITVEETEKHIMMEIVIN
jgi:RimJ/RimL family protein N-acetyltransferase